MSSVFDWQHNESKYERRKRLKAARIDVGELEWRKLVSERKRAVSMLGIEAANKRAHPSPAKQELKDIKDCNTMQLTAWLERKDCGLTQQAWHELLQVPSLISGIRGARTDRLAIIYANGAMRRVWTYVIGGSIECKQHP